ncbi:MAG: Mrp/NBP35 family ATP-binding protein, partial [Bacteroidota bacterium]
KSASIKPTLTPCSFRARARLVETVDLYGPSIPTMLGLKGQRPKVKDQNGQAKIVPLEAYGMPVMSIGFIIEPEQAVVLRGPRLGAIIKQFFNDCLWPPLDYLVVDLPPGTGDIQLTLVQTVPVTGSVIVTTPQEVAVVDAVKAMNMFLLPSVNVPIIGVVENMSWFTPEELPDNKYYIFGQGGGQKMADLSESTLLGQIPLVQGIREAGDGGQPIVLQQSHPMSTAFLDLAKNMIERVDQRNSAQSPTQRVDVKL